MFKIVVPECVAVGVTEPGAIYETGMDEFISDNCIATLWEGGEQSDVCIIARIKE